MPDITSVRRRAGSPAKQAEQMAIARPILDRFVELVVDLPVDVAEGTLFVTRETEVTYGVFAMSIEGVDDGLRAVRFSIHGDIDATAGELASLVTRQVALDLSLPDD